MVVSHRSSVRPFRVVVFAAVVLVVGFAVSPAVADTDQVGAPPETGTSGWWSPSYLVDYGLIAAGTATYIVGDRTEARADALIGPQYDPDDPIPIFESDELTRTYLEERTEETYPTRWLEITMFSVGVGVAGLEGTQWARGDSSARAFHDQLVGYAETTALTAAATEITKPVFGRLRPDFRDRALRYHCNEEPDRYDEYCEGYRGRPLDEDSEEARELLEDGRRSFISGHSSHSFNTFTYASLAVGGHFVWGERATTATRVAGIAAQTAMMGTAVYITGSRIFDGRHHTEDVVAGSLVGVGMANLSYWRRFDITGNPRGSGGETDTVSAGLKPFGAGPGVAVTGSF